MKESLHSMIAGALLAVLLAQPTLTPERQALEEKIARLEDQAKRAKTLRTFGLVTLVGAGVARETRSVFAGLQQWSLYLALKYDEAGERGYRQLADAQVVAWIVTASLVAATALFFGLGFGADPRDELDEARKALAALPSASQ